MQKVWDYKLDCMDGIDEESSKICQIPKTFGKDISPKSYHRILSILFLTHTIWVCLFLEYNFCLKHIEHECGSR